MTKPSRTQHEKVREHLEKANDVLKRSRAKAQASLAAHLEANGLNDPTKPTGGA